ncbi:Transcription factor tau 55 kDa subunit [Nakaseomyces bracarensis]|uniref:Transcription factor tau 55 kDa subunit n=1 Tax=Nakaseomyces bracarensis TaxID=273131 RepID=A0ABR4NLZ8_9SACH
MAVKTIYLARHGYRANWILGAEVPAPPTGINGDVQLAKHGIKQAHELGRYMLALDEQPELIFSSPFFRCLETSEPIADFLEVPVYIERGFGEWYRPDRPVIPVPADNETLEKFFHDKIRLEWESCAIPSEKGETEEELFKRCQDVLDKFIRKIEEDFPNVETVMIITHGATKIALGLSLLGRPTTRCTVGEGSKEYLRCGSCSLDKFQVQPELKEDANANDEDDDELVTTPPLERKWLCTMNGNTEFLSRGEEMNWGFHLNVEAGSDADIKSRIHTGPADQETVYVSIDIPSGSYKERFQLKSNSLMQFSGLNKDEPLVVVDNQLYLGSWQKLVGTELAFPSAATLKKKNHLNPDEDDAAPDMSQLELEDQLSDEFDEIKQEDESTEPLDSDEEEEQELERIKKKKKKARKRQGTSQKVYRITDRLLLQNVELM